MTAEDVNALVLQWWPLATGIARKWGARHPWLSDCFESLAGETLWDLARSHGHLVELPAFVRKGVYWAIMRRIEQELTRNPVAFGQHPVTDDGGGELLDVVPDDAPEVGAELDAADLVATLIRHAKLTPYQHALVIGYYFDDARYDELAAELGVTARGARGSLGLALGKLRAAAG